MRRHKTKCHNCKSTRCTCHSKQDWKSSALIRASNLSRLIPNLSLILNPDGTPLDATTVPRTWYRNIEGECFIEANPRNPKQIAILAMTDKFDSPDFFAFLACQLHVTQDGGCTWNQSTMVTTRFQGPGVLQPEASADPGLTWDQAGNLYVTMLGYNNFENSNEFLAIMKSVDGGSSFGPPFIIASDTYFGDGGHFIDSQVIFAHPKRPNSIYLTWQDLQGLVGPSTQTLNFFQKSLDGGSSWQPPVTYQNLDVITEGYGWRPRPVAMDDDVVVIMIENFPIDPEADTSLRPIYLFRSEDSGNTWQRFTINTQVKLVWPTDPVTGDIAGSPPEIQTYDLAANRKTGELYAVWSDPRFNPTGQASVVLSKSEDGGKTWSNPVPANPNTLNVTTFIPSIAVTEDGTVGVFFYDFRFYSGVSDPSLSTDAWLNIFDSDLNFKQEVRLTPTSFDMRQAVQRKSILGIRTVFFLGDYIELTNQGNDFIGAFVVTNPPYGIGAEPFNDTAFKFDPRNRQDVVFVRVTKNGDCFSCEPHKKDDLTKCAQPPAEPLEHVLLIHPTEDINGTYFDFCCPYVAPPPPPAPPPEALVATDASKSLSSRLAERRRELIEKSRAYRSGK